MSSVAGTWSYKNDGPAADQQELRVGLAELELQTATVECDYATRTARGTVNAVVRVQMHPGATKNEREAKASALASATDADTEIGKQLVLIRAAAPGVSPELETEEACVSTVLSGATASACSVS